MPSHHAPGAAGGSTEPPLLARLLAAQVGSCTCDTKTPELRYHAPLCHYRLFAEAHDLIGARVPRLPSEREVVLKVVDAICDMLEEYATLVDQGKMAGDSGASSFRAVAAILRREILHGHQAPVATDHP